MDSPAPFKIYINSPIEQKNSIPARSGNNMVNYFYIPLALLLIGAQAKVINKETDKKVCRYNWIANNGTCYLIESGTRRTFSRAKAWCQIEDGTLFVPQSMEENDFVMSKIPEMAFTWTGLSQMKQAPSFDHSSTVDITKLNWDEPYVMKTNWSATPDRCAVAENIHGKRKIYWTSCTEEHFYICEEKNKVVLQDHVMVNKTVKCDNGWIRFEDSCYFYERKTKAALHDAKNECEEKNATIFRPDSKKEYRAIIANTEVYAHTWTSVPSDAHPNDVQLSDRDMDWLVKPYDSTLNGRNYWTGATCAAYYNGNTAGAKYYYY